MSYFIFLNPSERAGVCQVNVKNKVFSCYARVDNIVRLWCKYSLSRFQKLQDSKTRVILEYLWYVAVFLLNFILVSESSWRVSILHYELFVACCSIIFGPIRIKNQSNMQKERNYCILSLRNFLVTKSVLTRKIKSWSFWNAIHITLDLFYPVELPLNSSVNFLWQIFSNNKDVELFRIEDTVV